MYGASAANQYSNGDVGIGESAGPPTTSTVVASALATAPRFAFTSDTKTIVPAGASIVSPATVNSA